ncbi:MAG: PRC-barrel domain-containing protein [Alphaproteobacteria bacterium]|nr:PRC-barrel domain-containing protein [Alphaproteobacteria bacterium]
MPAMTRWLTLLVPCALCAAAMAEPPESPAAIQKTQELNQQNADQAAQNYSQDQQQQQEYEQELKQYQADHQHYAAQAARYEAERDRYATERARYHRGEWPAHYEHLIVVRKDDLMNAEVQTYDGRYVGHVEELALSPSDHVDAVRVALRNGEGDAWIDNGDLRFDADSGIVMTDLDLHDLTLMASEHY